MDIPANYKPMHLPLALITLILSLGSHPAWAGRPLDERLLYQDKTAREVAFNEFVQLDDSSKEKIILLLVEVIENIENEKNHPDLLGLLKNYRICVRAAELLGRIGPAAAASTPALIRLLEDPNISEYKGYNSGMHAVVIKALGRLGPSAEVAVPLLIKRLSDTYGDVRSAAAQALRNMGPAGRKAIEEAVPSFIKVLRNPTRSTDNEARLASYDAARALGALGPDAREAVPDLMQAAQDADLRSDAIEALGDIGPDATVAVPLLRAAVRDRYDFVRRSAAEALEKIGTPEAVEAARPQKRREAFWKMFYAAMCVFALIPWLAFVVALALGALFVYSRRTAAQGKPLTRWPLLLATSMWMLYGIYECAIFFLQKGTFPIRVDLFVIDPFLMGSTIICILSWVVSQVLSLRKR